MSVGVASIDVPDEVRSGDYEVVLSISGGKDSTATALALREAGVPYRMVFSDTGWEADETYRHLDHLREKLGPIDVVGSPGGMKAKIEARAGFPSRLQRWCTQELKLHPLRAYFDEVEKSSGKETISVVGIRASESAKRAAMLPFEDSEMWGGYVWRPIIHWTVQDVLMAHHRHGVEVNPLYKMGHDRVGCYPCIHAGKNEISLIAINAPRRIDEIRNMELKANADRVERNKETPGRYKWEECSFFRLRAPDGRTVVSPIDDVVRWANTDFGGVQTFLLPPPPDSGCFRWGMCEAPVASEEEK